MPFTPSKREVPKVVCYVIAEGHLLVFTHDTVPLEVTGVQVPAGTIETGESPGEAAVREVWEETGLRARVVTSLGRERYDVSPTRAEIADRHFHLLALEEPVALSRRWTAGEATPSSGASEAVSWTCWWLPVEQAHVLAAGLGARIGAAWQHSHVAPSRPGGAGDGRR